MKGGMQREIVVAYWLLFDEFEIGEDDPPPSAEGDKAAAATTDTDPTRTRNR